MHFDWLELLKAVIIAVLGWLSGTVLPVPGKSKTAKR